MSLQIALIDPAFNTARELYAYLQRQGMFNEADLEKSEFYISVPNVHNEEITVDSTGQFTYDYKYGRETGQIQEYVKRVPFSRRTLSEEKIRRLKQKIPNTYRYIHHYNQEKSKLKAMSDKDRL